MTSDDINLDNEGLPETKGTPAVESDQDIRQSPKPKGNLVDYPSGLALPAPQPRPGFPVSEFEWEWLKKLVKESASFLSINTLVSLSAGSGISLYVAAWTTTTQAQTSFLESPFFVYGTACFIVVILLGLAFFGKLSPAHQALEYMEKIQEQARDDATGEKNGLWKKIIGHFSRS
jgi:hypothetical protein